MKRLIKYLIIILIAVILVSSIIFIDYYSAKANGTNPKISIKEESENSIVYKAVFYRVFFCKTNKKYIFGDYSEEIVCPNNYVYKDGYYTNSEEINISKRDLQLLTNDGTYTSEMIENLKTETEVKNAVDVAYNFGLIKHKVIDEEDEYNIVVFPTFKSVEDNYDWIYDEEERYCLKGENYNYQRAKYENNKCGKYEKIKMDEKWCELYKTSTLVYVKGIENLCKQ